MSNAGFERVKRSYFTGGTVILFILMAIGFIAAIQRYAQGLGATTNLSDQYPWGIWIAFDILCGVALAAGGFTVAAVAYVFGGKKYHSLVRPAVLTAFLGYLFVAVGLLVDLGIPWHIWHPIIYWPPHSAMFEVAWCVMLYLTVLALEFAPSVFERFGWDGLHKVWNALVPWYTVVALAFFVYIMTDQKILPAILTLVVLAILAVVLPAAVKSRPGVPILLIMAGILFSTAHQSSLGTLFLLMPDKLSKLWYSPMLPVNFFLTAVAVGFGMVIFEATFAAVAFGRKVEKEPLAGLGRICAWVLWIYLAVRLIDVGIQGGYADFANGGTLFVIELLIGVLIPALMMSSAAVRNNTGALFTSGLLVVIGVVINRFNVSLGGMSMEVVGEGGAAYFPSIQELLITIGIVAAIMFFYNIAVKMFPVFEREEGASA